MQDIDTDEYRELPMTDVVLVQPKVGDMDYLRSHPALPLSVLSAANLVSMDYKVRIIDQRVDKEWCRTLLNELEKEPLCVGVTTKTGKQIRYALDTAGIVKKNCDMPVVWGGVHPSLLPQQTLENGNVDIIVRGEGELSFLELVRHLESGESLAGVEGIWYKENEVIHTNEDRPFVDLNALPELPYQLIDVKKYLPKYMKQPTFYMETSRGCPYNCYYCYNQSYHKRTPRYSSAEKTLERVEKAKKDFKVENIYFVDDEFFADLRRAREIGEGLAKLGINWQCQGVTIRSISRMDDGYLRLLERSGCKRITIGIESGSPRIQNILNKNINLDEAVTINKKLSEYNLIVFYSFIGGFPTETVEELKMTINLMFRLLEDNPHARTSPIYTFTPFPGTPLFDFAVKNGFVPPETLEEWCDFEWGLARLSFLSKKMKKLLPAIYLPSGFIDDKFDEYTVPRTVKALITLYRPVARFRTRNLFMKFMFEKWLLKMFQV